eukprot:364652-Chlamydomonas_euryale.AAC.2
MWQQTSEPLQQPSPPQKKTCDVLCPPPPPSHHHQPHPSIFRPATPRPPYLRVWQEVGKLLQQVVVAAEEVRDLVIHAVDCLLALAVHVEDLEERLVHAVVARKAVLDLVHVANGLVKLNRLLLHKLPRSWWRGREGGKKRGDRCERGREEAGRLGGQV